MLSHSVSALLLADSLHVPISAIRHSISSKSRMRDASSLVDQEKHQYDSLSKFQDGMRLIKLHPGRSKDKLRCTVLTRKLSSRPSYEALSYVWGDEKDKERVDCGDGYIEVTANLAVALRHLRFRHRSRILYADAICINQADVAERSAQVQLMAEIYHNAQSVVVWLGSDGTGHAGLAMKWIRSYAEYASREWSKTDSSPDFKPFEEFGDQRPETDAIEAISDLLHRPWFRRVWVLQEAALARRATVMCGASSIPLETLICFADAARRSVSEAHEDRLNTVYISNCYSQIWAPYGTTRTWMEKLPFEPPYQYQDGTARLPLGDLIRMTLSRDTTDQRDRIYAVLGHPALWVRDLQDTLVQADYTISLEEVCRRTTIAAIERKQDLSLLSLVQHGSKNPYASDAASWVPNLNIESNIMDFLFFTAGTDLRFEASISNMQLQCRGVAIGQVTCPIPAFPYSADLHTGKAALSFVETFDALMRLRPRPKRGSTYADLSLSQYLACLLLSPVLPRADMDAWEDSLESDVELLRDFMDWQFPHASDSDSEKSSHRNLLATGFDQKDRDYFEKLFFYCSNRRVFRTACGLWGLGPGPVQDGDFCCVINGTRMPYILSPRANSKDEFEFAGECYVPGLMFGEVAGMLEEGRAQERVFTIC